MSNPAMELGLMEENSEPRMMFFQLPTTIPMIKQTSAASQDSTSSSKTPSGSNPIEKAAGLKDLQAGIMGKLLMYKSGAVKLKLGDALYDASLGSDCTFAQDVVAINSAEKH
ncbi:DNA-directed RNA polymerase III subunit RPC4-like [Chenopodium quinoa]|nr:DNA-directed RNA polymerase III subunit RPC4-like [Chenopodium quinoa]